MRMNLERVQLFLRIVDAGTLSAAARLSHLTQPALSRSLKLLEEELGVPLFYRRGRGLVLSASGRALVPKARALLATAESVAREVGRSAERAYFDLRLGAVDSVATYLLPGSLPRLQARFPTLAIKLYADRTAHLLSRVRQGELDFAVVAHSGPPPDAASQRLGPYELSYYGRKDRFPTLAKARTYSDLEAFPLIEIEATQGQPSLIGDRTATFAVAQNLYLVKTLVVSGFGVGELLDFVLSPAEAETLCRARVPHDPHCALFVVSAKTWTGPLEQKIAGALAETLTRSLAARRKGARSTRRR
jgi:DNA-binding transcriptional LysR family regulator